MMKNNLLRAGRAASEILPKSHSFAARRARFLPTSPISSILSTSRSLPLTYPQGIGQRRWQTTQAEGKAETPAAEAEGTTPEAAKEDASKLELEQKNKEIVELKDKYLRSVADFRNLQERTKRDMESAKQFAIQRFATDLLDSIDNLDRALESVPKESMSESSTSTSADPKKDLISLFSGVKMTSEILLNVMKKHGLERFDPLDREGHKFNPQTDEATFFTKVEGKQDGEVFFTQSKGFTLNGRVVRAAKVGVVKNS